MKSTKAGHSSALLSWLSIAGLWGLWEAATRIGWVPITVFPPPSVFVRYVIAEDFSIGFGGTRTTLAEAVAASFLRILFGLTASFGAALLLGSLIAASRICRGLALPIVRLFSPIAPIGWIPLALALFGIGNVSAVFIVFMGVAPILTIATLAAIGDVPSEYLKVAATLGANGKQAWVSVILPAIIPQVFNLLRLNFFVAWMAVLAAEMVGLRSGIGAVVLIGRESANANLVLAGMSLIGITGYIIDQLLVFLQKRILWWNGGIR